MRCARLILLALGLAGAAGTNELDGKIVDFHKHYSVFFRDYFGCPKGAQTIEACEPRAGMINYREFAAAKKAAKTLFD